MIDEKMLKKDLEETVRVSVKSGDCTARKLLGLFTDVIDSQPKVDEWIPCSERPPEVKGHYLVTIMAYDGKHVSMCSFNPSDPDDVDFWSTGLDIIAWKSKPEPWEGETE